MKERAKTSPVLFESWVEVLEHLTAHVGLPQNVIARYLGIDKATMSRLRRDPERLARFMRDYPYQAKLSRLVRAAVDREEARAVLLEGLGGKPSQPDPRSTGEFILHR